MPLDAPVTIATPVPIAENLSASVARVELEEAIRGRRTHKAYGPDPVPRETLDELFDLARWAPNHHLTNPWRFRVLGERALAKLKQVAGPGERRQARPRAHARVRLGGAQRRRRAGRGGPLRRRVRGVHRAAWPPTPAGWRATGARPGVLRTREGAAAVGMGPDELFVSLIHLGHAREEKRAPDREPPGDFVTYLE